MALSTGQSRGRFITFSKYERLDQTAHHSTWRGREREIGKNKMNNLNRHQQLYLTKVTFYFFKRNNFRWGETTLS